MPINERKTWFCAAMDRSSESKPCSLREGGRSSGRERRMLFGTAASIKSSSEAKPHVSSMASVCSALGPMWRRTKRSVQANEAAAEAVEVGVGVFTVVAVGRRVSVRYRFKIEGANLRPAGGKSSGFSTVEPDPGLAARLKSTARIPGRKKAQKAQKAVCFGSSGLSCG